MLIIHGEEFCKTFLGGGRDILARFVNKAVVLFARNVIYCISRRERADPRFLK